MAGWVYSRALFLVMLTGVSYGYPAAKGFDPSSYHGTSYGVDPASAGSSWGAPSTDVSGAAAQPPAAPAAASSSSNSFPAPVHSGYSTGSAQPSSFRPASTQDITWAVAPPSPFSGEGTPMRPSTHRFASSRPAPEPLGPSNVSPPVLEYQAGELSHVEDIYEHGNYKSETEEQGFQPPPPGVSIVSGQDSYSEVPPSGLGRGWVPYPYDYMLLTGQYPPGTVSHFSSSFEQGSDYWQDAHYIRDYYPTSPSTEQVETIPADTEATQSIKQPSQPIKLTAGSTGYGQSAAVSRQNQPYRRVGLPSGHSLSKPGIKW